MGIVLPGGSTASVRTYKGPWNPSTNTPTLVDGTGTEGDFYRASSAGTRNLGSGSQTYAINDYVLYRSGVWSRLAGSGPVDAGSRFCGCHIGALASSVLTQYFLRYKTILIPSSASLTGIGIANGNVVGGNLKVYLADVTSLAIVASSASTAQGTAGLAQKIPFAAPINVPAGRWIIGVVSDSTTAQYYSTTMGLDPIVVASNASFALPASLPSAPTDISVLATPIIWTY